MIKVSPCCGGCHVVSFTSKPRLQFLLPREFYQSYLLFEHAKTTSLLYSTSQILKDGTPNLRLR